MPIFRNINKDFFKVWSNDMAYVLGFIYADGNIIHTKRDTWFWSIQITDREILEKIKFALGSSHKISIKKATENHKEQFRLQIGSKTMCKDLILLGLTERKSLTICFPKVPVKYFSDFIRGYFDGDGGVWVGFKNKRLENFTYIISSYFTSGNMVFLENLQRNLEKRGVFGGSLVKKERGFDLKYSVKASLKLYKVMYNGKVPYLFLKRKRDKFEKYIKMRS